MTARTKKITKSLEDAKKIEENLKKTEEEHGARINQAKKEAQVILAEANKQAEKQREETIALAKKESAKIVQETRGTIAQEKDKMISEVREEVAELITGSVGQILGKNIHLELDEKIIKEAIKKIR
jgi:F-type H+-transporting ATPase subunit b